MKIEPQVTLYNNGSVTVKMDARTFNSILTQAALNLYKTRDEFKPAPETGDYASIIARNNADSLQWFEDMLNTVKQVQGEISDQIAHPHKARKP